MHDHAPQLDLMPLDTNGQAVHATHVAARAGDWFDPGTWASGTVPGEGALVHIPAGISVGYAGASDAALFMVRVDGSLTLTAPNGAATRMVVDTMITSDNSFLHVDADGATDGTVDIVFAEGTPAAHQSHFTDTSPGDGVIGRHAWDPEQLSLGIVASGEVKIEGQDVAAGLQLAEGPLAGESTLVFAADLDGIDTWVPGQTLVIGGMDYLGRDADGHLIAEDEVREIAAVQTVGNTVLVTLDRPLDHDHVGPAHPDTGIELTGHVANMSRTVSFSSAAADPDGDGVPARGQSLGETLEAGGHHVTERAHIMFMHNDDVLVSNAGLYGLGRTDKSTDVDDFQLASTSNHNARLFHDANGDGVYDPDTDFAIETPADAITNQRGRYALHIHQAGASGEHAHGHDHVAESAAPAGTETEHLGPALPGRVMLGPCAKTGDPLCHCGDADGDGDIDCDDGHDHDHGADITAPTGAVIEGNAVWGSPGWGIVQHSSVADLTGNVVYDVAGAAIVAESGDEVGRWQDNLTIGTYGARPGNANEDADDFNEDDGFQGTGFYTKSRVLEIVDNTAHSSARAGFMYHNNGTGLVETRIEDAGISADAAPGLDSTPTEDIAIEVFTGNTAIAAFEGLRISVDPTDGVRKYSDAYSVLSDFTAVAAEESGVSITYSGKYIFDDFLVLGTESEVTATTAGFFFKASVADITVSNSHVEGFDHAVKNWTQVGDRQEYRRGYWDPKRPTGTDHVEPHGQLTHDAIGNAAQNLWNNNLVNVTHDNLTRSAFSFPLITLSDASGTTVREQGVEVFETGGANSPDLSQPVEIDLIGDSAAGGLVALWREDIATHPDQALMLATHIPLSYGETVYLSQVHMDTGLEKRNTYEDYVEGINADIWSGTALEFIKTDSLGTQVFEYGDFSPLTPGQEVRDVTTNEKILFTREMIDGVLRADGYFTLPGHDGAKFVEMSMVFTDRLTGQWEVKTFLVGLDLGWEIPAEALNLGTVRATTGVIVADQYVLFRDGLPVDGAAPISGAEIVATSEAQLDLLSEMQVAAQMQIEGGGFGVISSARPDAPEAEPEVDLSTLPVIDLPLPSEPMRQLGTGGRDMMSGGAGDDRLIGGQGDDDLAGGGGADVLRGGAGQDMLSGDAGEDALLGRAGDDTMFGGLGDDDMRGGAGADWLDGAAGRDAMEGGAGSDALFGGLGDDWMGGGRGHDLLDGGAGRDMLRGGGGRDRLTGGDGDDRLEGGSQSDHLSGGEGADTFVFHDKSGNDVIDDFEKGVDAIEFMIQSFGFEDLEILDDGEDTVVEHDGGSIRLNGVDAGDLDAQDFTFAGLGA